MQFNRQDGHAVTAVKRRDLWIERKSHDLPNQTDMEICSFPAGNRVVSCRRRLFRFVVQPGGTEL
jgi:hypothetical protein